MKFRAKVLAGRVDGQWRIDDKLEATHLSSDTINLILVAADEALSNQPDSPEQGQKLDLQHEKRDLDQYSSRDDDQVSRAIQYVWDKFGLEAYTEKAKGIEHIIKLVLPTQTGYVVHSNCLKQRLLSCNVAQDVIQFKDVGQKMQHVPYRPDGAELLELVHGAFGGVLAKTNQPLVETTLHRLELDLFDRLSFPWIIGSPVPMRRLALVEGRPDYALGEWVFQAAQDLGIELVVLDRPGHWLQSASNAHLRKAFLPVDISLDDGLPRRIVETLDTSGLVVDGIVTFRDAWVVPVARAAEMLKLPTPPLTAVDSKTNTERA